MTSITPYNFQGHDVRVVTGEDGDPWFVLNDLCSILGIGNSRMVAARLDEDCVSQTDVADSMGRIRRTTVITEPGMYDVIVRSDSPQARPFRRWVTHEVLPSIRKTGSYSTAPKSDDEIVHQALQITTRKIEALEAKNRELTPKADAFDGYIGADGDYSINATAKLLQRRGIETGQNRLARTLLDWGWLYRGEKRRLRAKQSQIVTGRLAEKTYYYIDDLTGDRMAGATTVRITPKGVDDIFKRLTPPTLEVVSS